MNASWSYGERLSDRFEHMCGIVGYVGARAAGPILFDALRRLEYRGYDSSGIAVINGTGKAVVERSAGKLAALIESVGTRMPEGSTGLGHTRWATHGSPTFRNAHPHSDCTGKYFVVHNGIVENYRELKKRLTDSGHEFTSDTDSEVIAHLVEEKRVLGLGLKEAVIESLDQLEGAFSIAVAAADDPNRIIGGRVGHGGGIVVGYGQDEMFLASDLPAIAPYARKAVHLKTGELAVVDASGVRYFDREGEWVARTPAPVAVGDVTFAKGGYKHFMLKEIMEQPESVTNLLRGRISFDPPDILLPELTGLAERLADIGRVVLVGMGTSLHAAAVGARMFEALARVPSVAENASEFRYREPVIDNSTLVIAVSQSGETVDTLAGMEEARDGGACLMAVTNNEHSQASMLADWSLDIRAGTEIGVASTKCLTNSILALYLVACYVGRVRGLVSGGEVISIVDDLARLPSLMSRSLETDGVVRELARQHYRTDNYLFLGRGISYPVAMEGALKLKEVSYCHAEGYQAGEMKHGPIALIDEDMPVVAMALQDALYPKMVNNIEEVKARNGRVIAVATEGDEGILSLVDHVIHVPGVPELISPVVSVIPLQLFAYHVAVTRGCDVDQPRNLAKSVTVE